MENNDLFRVGCFASTHGVKGEFKVFPTTDDPSRFTSYKEIVLDNGKIKKTAEVVSARYFKQMVILKIKGVDSMDDAEKLRGYELFVSRDNAIPLEENEYYVSDLYDLNVFSDEGEELGILSDVIQTGANDVYEVTLKGGKKVLLPAIKECILKVDIPAGTMTVHLIPGILDI